MVKKKFEGIKNFFTDSIASITGNKANTTLLAVGSMLSKQQWLMNSTNINDYEFKIFSQWGDDGIIQYLIKNIDIQNNTFIEFGVENYDESNTRFLMMNNNWSGFIMDASFKSINRLRRRRWYWKYTLKHKSAFLDTENVNQLLSESGFSNIGLLSIDIDGNDYFILKNLDLSKLNPSIIIVEYNSVFGSTRAITVPYRKDFVRTKAHYSNLFFGASLSALNEVASAKGYALVGCTLAGNNAFFIRKDLLNEKVKGLAVQKGFKESKFRESRDRDYSLSFLSGNDRLEEIKGLEVLNVLTNQIEVL